MKIEIYSLKDCVAGNFKMPFYMQNVGVAKRAVRNVLQDVNNDIAKNPTDFDLFKLGTFDDNQGVVEFKQEFICHCNELLTSPIKEDLNGNV